MKHRSSPLPWIFGWAVRAIAKITHQTRRAATVAVVCLAVLTLAVMGLTKVSGASRTPARPQEAAAGGSTFTFTTIDAPGAGTGMLQGTMGTSINDAGDIAGVYLTAPNVAHGFVRALANGTASFATFDAPGAGTSLSQGTFPASINAAGDVAGMYFDANNAYHGFVRAAASGTLTPFDVPAAPTSIGHRGTLPISMNAGGNIAGFYVDASDVRHGFVRTVVNGTATFTSFDVAAAGTSAKQGTVPMSIDTAGDITGFYTDANGTFHGFVRISNGTITAPIDAPGAGTGASGKVLFMGTLPRGFDAAGDIAGTFADANGVNHGFVYTAASATPAFTTFDAPGVGTSGFFPGTGALNINAGGDTSGLYTDTTGVRHGFFRAAAGTITAPIDAPSAATTGMFSGTILASINTADELTGTFADTNGVFHGFLLAAGSAPAAATPTFSPAAGSYTSPQMVTISDATAGAMIFFTTDGTTPTTSSTKFTGPIAVNSTETIEAIAAASGFSNSAVASATYTINAPPPDFQVSVNPSSLTIVAGQSGKATFTVTPENGFNSPVSFACSGLPSGAACGFNPTPVTPNGAAIATTLTVTTTAPGAAAWMPMPPSQRPTYAVLFPVLAVILGIAARRRRAPRGLHFLGLLILLMAVSGLTSCGGSSSMRNPGTPVGTSMASVSAAASGAGGPNHTATLTITITH